LQAGEERLARRTTIQRHFEQRPSNAVSAVRQAAIDDGDDAPQAVAIALGTGSFLCAEPSTPGHRAMQADPAPIPLYDGKPPADPDELRQTREGEAKVSDSGGAHVGED